MYLPLSRVAIIAISLAVVFAGIVVPLTISNLRSQHNTTKLNLQDQIISNQQAEIRSISTITNNLQTQTSQLRTILGIATGATRTQTQVESTAWVIKQLQALCGAFQTRPNGLPACTEVPLPQSLQQLINSAKIPPAKS